MTALAAVLAKSARRGRPSETLTAHLAATLDAATQLARRIGRITAVAPVLGDDFWTVVRWAALTHDAGKVAAGFQDMVTGRVRTWGQRHEVLSLGFLPALVDDEHLRRWVAYGVVTHHRALTDSIRGGTRSCLAVTYRVGIGEFTELFGTVDPATVRALADWLRDTGRAAGLPTGTGDVPDLLPVAHQSLAVILDEWDDDASDDDNLAAILVQGAVTLADHLSSAHGSLHHNQPVNRLFAKALTESLAHPHPHQRRAAAISGHLLLRAPTGSGKTEGGLLWAARQVEEIAVLTGGTPRVFLTLPYLASINAMAARLGLLLGDDSIGVAHSRAASYHLSTSICPEDDEQARVDAAHKAVSRAAATRLFAETVRVATPYQLMRGALAGPAHSGIVVDSANSVFILDELHAYEPRRLGFILATMRLWERLGGRIAVLSATLPAALGELITNALEQPVEHVDAEPGTAPPRHRLAIRHRGLTDPETIDEIAGRIAAGHSVLVVANNVAHAQELYEKLGPDARERYGPDGAILLHSRFRRRERLDLEQRIGSRYGTRATRAGGLVVATQVVEVSLDVDFDALFTSGAPLEALLQRFGRVNRLGRRAPADVVVHQPTYGTRRGGGTQEYADGVYPREPVEAGWRILVGHDATVVDETQANGWLDEVYAGPWGQQWRQNVETARSEFHDVFLTFKDPYDDRSRLTEAFDEMFDGTEAILDTDRADYEAALHSAGQLSAGRLLADDYLIPMPVWASKLTRYDRTLGVVVVNGDYDKVLGLCAVRGPESQHYRIGELI
ncbi:CRISPR-associated helicase Cas3' [Polymorphospora rubra]|uniref:CRISPR-associated helicase Cas3' n=1 Tax=Polymorphospora rubra TaxID=338584 RepID=UPI0033C0BA0F